MGSFFSTIGHYADPITLFTGQHSTLGKMIGNDPVAKALGQYSPAGNLVAETQAENKTQGGISPYAGIAPSLAGANDGYGTGPNPWLAATKNATAPKSNTGLGLSATTGAMKQPRNVNTAMGNSGVF